MAKRIVICCDGTWDTPESKNVSNVVKITRAIKPKTTKGMEQIVFYDWGVGTEDFVDKIFGGAFGEGIDKNIQDAYRFLVHNYAPGDEVFIFGFSRGAYTARSLIGLVRNSGLLKKVHADLIPKAYQLYRQRSGPDVKKAKEFRQQYSREIPITFLGVWDSVGALGIPLGIFHHENEEKYGFHDTSLSRIIKNAYHALSIDEKRKPFAPAIWKTKPEHSNTEQAWFAGVHADIGGGYKEAALSNLALKWMCDKAKNCGLELNNTYLSALLKRNNIDKLHISYKGVGYKLLGKYVRPIGVSNPDETLHPSVMKRHKNKSYNPSNLRDYLKQQGK